MKRHKVVYSQEAIADRDELFDVIAYDFQAPATAIKYIQELVDTVKQLQVFPEAFPIQTNSTLSRYGANVRRINYKKMAIIYTVHDDTVYIHRIMAGALILE